MFRWYLAPFHVPILRSIIQLVYAVINCIQAMNGTVTLNRSVLQVEYTRTIAGYTFYTQYRSRCKRFQLWCKPYSFAMTAGIQCCTLSSAYQYAYIQRAHKQYPCSFTSWQHHASLIVNTNINKLLDQCQMNVSHLCTYPIQLYDCLNELICTQAIATLHVASLCTLYTYIYMCNYNISL